MERWTRFVLRHRLAVLGVWVAVLLASLAAMAGLSDLLTNRFTLPNTDTARAEDLLEEHFGQKSTGSFTLVVEAPGRAREIVPAVRAAAARAAAELPTARVAAVQPVSEDVATALIVSEQAPAEAKLRTDAMRRAAGTIPGARLYVTGQAAVEHDLDPVFAEDLKVGELYVAIPIALALLVFVFGTLAFLIPFLVALAAIPATLGIIWIIANFMELTTYLQNMVMLIGLGIAVDYSLLVVHRFREELSRPWPAAAPAGQSPAPPSPDAADAAPANGPYHRTVPLAYATSATSQERERALVQGSDEDAIVRTMATAGRAVVFSGTAVAIGLALLLFMPLPFMRGFGIGGLLIPTVSVVCALTLLPVLLLYLGRRLDRIRLVPSRILERRQDEERGFWPRLARTIMRRPVPFAAGATAALLLLAAPVLDLEVGPGTNQGIPEELEAVRGLRVLEREVGAGALAPTDLVVDAGGPGRVRNPAVENSLASLATSLEADPQVARIERGDGPRFVDRSEQYLHLQVVGKSEYGKPEALAFVERLRDEYVPAAAFPPGASVYAGGGPPGGRDFLDLTYGTFPYLVLAVLLATYVLLARAFRSLLLPLKAIILNLLAIGAAYGLLVVVFKWGLGEHAGLIGYDQVEGWIPVMLFTVLFGLSMDYEVFLVSRMREEWDAGRSNEEAVALGLAKTGRLVTAAGLIMFAAFMGFVAGSVVGLQQLGFGLAAAILIDVTIVRALLVPSAMKVFGRWNWWLPEGAARLLRVPPSPLDGPRPALRPAGR